MIVPEAPRSAEGVAKLADFGVAHLAGDDALTRTGDVVGTLAYMAPEQAAGKRVDERVDLYSLALVLYEVLAGENPVRAGSPAATARRVGTVLPPLRRCPQGPAGGAVRGDRPCAAPAPGRARDALGAGRRARGIAARGLRRRRRDGRPAPVERSAPARPRPRRRGAAGRRARRRRARVAGAAAAARAGRGRRRRRGAAARLARERVATIGLIAAERPGAALLVAAALAPVPLLLRPPRHAVVAAGARAVAGAGGPRRDVPRAGRAGAGRADAGGAGRARRLVGAVGRPAARRRL